MNEYYRREYENEDEDEYREEIERAKTPLERLMNNIFRDVALELPPILSSESTAEEYLEHIIKRRSIAEKVLEEKYKALLERDYSDYLQKRGKFEDSKLKLKHAVTDFATARSIQIFQDCRFECEDSAKNYTLHIMGDYPKSILNMLLSKTENILCVADDENSLEYLLIGNETYHVIAEAPEEPVKYEELKKFLLGMIDNTILLTKNRAEKDKQFEKLLENIIDDRGYHKLRNENQRIFYLTHKYSLSKKDAKYIIDMLAAAQALS